MTKPEDDDFADAMADVTRLKPDPRGRTRAPRLVALPLASTTPGASPSAAPGEDDTSEAGFVVPGVDRRELRKLKRGEYIPGDRLDLHGHTGAEAVASVRQFIDSARHRHRCVCIVHGRGLHSRENVSVLRTRVRECLRQHPATLAYTDAPRTDGGSGAVYVLLRK